MNLRLFTIWMVRMKLCGIKKKPHFFTSWAAVPPKKRITRFSLQHCAY